MKLLRYALAPALIAGALLMGAVGFASASASGTLDTVTPTASQQAAPALDAAAVCAKVTAAEKPHPVLRELCGLYSDPAITGHAHDTIGKVIVKLAMRHHKHGKHAPTLTSPPSATATPSVTG